MTDIENVNIQQLLQVTKNQLIDRKDNPKAIVNKSVFSQVIGVKGKVEKNSDKSDDESVVSSTGNMPAFFLNDPMRIDESKEHILQNQFMKKGFGTTFRKPKKNHESSRKQQSNEMSATYCYESSTPITSNLSSNNSTTHQTGQTLSLKEQFVQKKRKSTHATPPGVESMNSANSSQEKENKKVEVMNTWESKKRNLSSNNTNSNEFSQPDSTVYSPTPDKNHEEVINQNKNAAQLRLTLERNRSRLKAKMQKQKLTQDKKTVERNLLVFKKAVIKPNAENQFPTEKELESDIANEADVDEDQNSEIKDVTDITQKADQEMKTEKDTVTLESNLTCQNISNESVDLSKDSVEEKKASPVRATDDFVTSTKVISRSSTVSPKHMDAGKPPIIMKKSPHVSRASSTKISRNPVKQDQGEQTSPMEDNTVDEREYDDDVSEISSIHENRRQQYLRRSASQRVSRYSDVFTDQEESFQEPYSKMSHPNIHKRNSMSQIRPPIHPNNSNWRDNYYHHQNSHNHYMTDAEDGCERTSSCHRLDFSSDTEGRTPSKSNQRPYYYPLPYPYTNPYMQNFPPNLYEQKPDMQIPFYPVYHYPNFQLNQNLPPPVAPQLYNSNYFESQLPKANYNESDAFRNQQNLLNSSLDLTRTNNQLEELQKKLHIFQEEVKLMTSHQRLFNNEQERPIAPLLSNRDFLTSSNSTLNDTATNNSHQQRKKWDKSNRNIYVNPDTYHSRFRNEEPFVKRSVNIHNHEHSVPPPVKLPTFTSKLEEIKSQPLDLQAPNATSPLGDKENSEEHYMTYPILRDETIKNNLDNEKIIYDGNNVDGEYIDEMSKNEYSDPDDIMSLPTHPFSYNVDEDSFSILEQRALVAKPSSLVIEYDQPNLDKFQKKIQKMKEREQLNKEARKKIQEEGRYKTEARQKEEALRSEKKQQMNEKKREILEAYKTKKEENQTQSLIETKTPTMRRMSSVLSSKGKAPLPKRPAMPMPNSSRYEPTLSVTNRHLSPTSEKLRKIPPSPIKESNGNIPGWASKHTSEVDLRSFDRTIEINATIRRKHSKTNSVSNLAVSHQGSLSISNQQPALSASRDLKLFVKPKIKSNKSVIKNAIQFCCLAGGVNEVNREATLKKLFEANAQHFIILFRDSRCQYRGLYTFDGETEECNLLVGTGPNRITHDMVELFYKYNSGAKKFTPITTTKHLSTVVDAISVQNNFWQVRASVNLHK